MGWGIRHTIKVRRYQDPSHGCIYANFISNFKGVPLSWSPYDWWSKVKEESTLIISLCYCDEELVAMVSPVWW